MAHEPASRQEGSMMEELPTEIMTKVLLCLDIASRIKLASCNRMLQERVYRECSGAWEVVGRFTLDDSVHERLTDLALSNLLNRVDAVHVTKVLVLRGCSQIRGDGLAPSQGSRILDTLNLQDTAAEENPSQVLWILESMVSFKLLDIIVSQDASDRFTELKMTLRRVRLEQAKNEDMKCSCCHEPLLDKAQQILASEHGYPLFQCFECEKRFCRRVSCPMCVRECQNCGDTNCKDCDIVQQCFLCGHSYCNLCRALYDCNECENTSCADCGGVKACSNGACTNNVCRQCGNCPQLCTNGCLFCKSCRENGACTNCNEKFCFECTEGSQVCSVCSKTYCEKPACVDETTTCQACDETFCNECKVFQHCVKCNKDFCAKHNRLVDCSVCEMRHCRGCRLEELCKLCTTPCFEPCVCEKANPAKRPKLS